MAFTVTVNGAPTQIIVNLTGVLDEHAGLPTLPPTPLVKVNMENMENINSIGVRKWIRWLQELSPFPKVELFNCPVIFVRSLSSIKGMLAPNVTVRSFYVPFYCDATDDRDDVLFVQGEQFFDDGRLEVPSISLASGEKMEIDVVEDIYFSFLKR